MVVRLYVGNVDMFVALPHFPKSILNRISLLRYISAVKDSVQKYIVHVNSVAEISIRHAAESPQASSTFKLLSFHRVPRLPAVTQLLTTLPLEGFIPN
jgi:hypothetical protein